MKLFMHCCILFSLGRRVYYDLSDLNYFHAVQCSLQHEHDTTQDSCLRNNRPISEQIKATVWDWSYVMRSSGSPLCIHHTQLTNVPLILQSSSGVKASLKDIRIFVFDVNMGFWRHHLLPCSTLLHHLCIRNHTWKNKEEMVHKEPKMLLPGTSHAVLKYRNVMAWKQLPNSQWAALKGQTPTDTGAGTCTYFYAGSTNQAATANGDQAKQFGVSHSSTARRAVLWDEDFERTKKLITEHR